MRFKELTQHQSVTLPEPETQAYFPDRLPYEPLAQAIIERVGVDNLAYALSYGSQGTSDASPDSMFDAIVIVQDPRRYYERSLQEHKAEHGRPHRPGWHTFLNHLGFNFYYTQITDENGQARKVKLAVIGEDEFIKGCSGTLHYKDAPRPGAFGMYVAGRIQKAALTPLYKGEAETVIAIESAINAARIDGVWFALGFLPKQFSYEELLHMYVSLSYRVDVRPEKKTKVDALIENSREDYAQILKPIIAAFMELGLLSLEGETLIKNQSLTPAEVELRVRELREINFMTNYFKNILSPGILRGLSYAVAKVKRVVKANRKRREPTQNNLGVL